MSSLVEEQSADLTELLRSVWLSFLDQELIEVPRQTPEFARASELPTASEVLASISISGSWNGWFHLATSHECANEIAAVMFQMDVAEIGIEESVDALGELANIVGGNIKSMLPAPSLLSLPAVEVDRQVSEDSDGVLGLVSVMDWQDHTIVASLWEAVNPVGAEF